MSALLLGGLAVFLLIYVAYRAMSPGVVREVARAQRSGDVERARELLAALEPAAQLDAYNRAIRQLWDAYDRELAVPLIVDLADRHTEQRIAQYWIDQLRRVEPELLEGPVREALAQLYRPEIAARCGAFG